MSQEAQVDSALSRLVHDRCCFRLGCVARGVAAERKLAPAYPADIGHLRMTSRRRGVPKMAPF